MNDLFFELIRVSVGNADRLSHIPTPTEWHQLYAMAKKQSLIGVCFAGVQRLCGDAEEGCAQKGMSDSQYLKWLGVAAQIQQRNESMNRQCVELQTKLSADGFRSAILKGQGLLLYYGDTLQELRQPGDIDVWIDGTREQILEYVNRICPTDHAGDLHVSFGLFADTVVELHFTPSIASDRKKNLLLQRWLDGQKESCYTNRIILSDNDIICPPTDFNLVFLLLHIFGHYLYEGIGLRQVMDYYFVLRHCEDGRENVGFEDVKKTICDLGLQRFASALLWAIGTVFEGNPAIFSNLSLKLCGLLPDAKRGHRFMEVVMEGGNFGHSTQKYKITGWDKPCTRLSRYVRRNWYMLQDYPGEILSNFWKRLNRIR